MAGQLFLRSYERSDRIYNAMLSRGYQGQLMTIHPHSFVRQDVLVGVFSIFALILIQIVGRLS
jgi:cobalt/nickel transport system permease protein